MKRHEWSCDPSQIITAFEQRYPHAEAAALLQWAFPTCESLCYLVDLCGEPTIYNAVVAVHHQDVVDVSHARWAAMSSITSLDLAFAGLARAVGGYSARLECDIGKYSSPSKQMQVWILQLPPDVRSWLNNIINDPAYLLIKEVRNALTHRRLPRNLHLMVGGPSPGRSLELNVSGCSVSIAEIVTTAYGVSARHLEHLLRLLPLL
jgi:hypothetical protein